MQQDEVKRFIEQVRNNTALQGRLGNASDENSLIDALVRLGKDNGYSFTDAQVRSELSSNAARPRGAGSELTDAELEAVAGGGFIAMIQCALTIKGGTCSQKGGGVGCMSGTSRA